MNRPRILIVNDDPSIIEFLAVSLQARGCEVVTAMDSDAAIQAVDRERPDLVILETVMSGMDSLEVCRRMSQRSQIPVIMLSGRGNGVDKMKCLGLGAEDCITEPVTASELMARIRAVFRRARGDMGIAPVSYNGGAIGIDCSTKQVKVSGNEVKLMPTEFELLKELVSNEGKVVTYAYLLNRIWGARYRQKREYLDVFIKRLRDKIEPQPDSPRYILSVPGIGYRFQAAG